MSERNPGWKAGVLGISGIIISLFLILLVSNPVSPNLPPLEKEYFNTHLYPLVVIPVILIGTVIGAYVVFRGEKK